MSLLPHHQQLLDDRAISTKVATERGYYSVSEPKELTKLFGSSQRLAPGLVIPVKDVYRETVFHQLRPDEPRTVKGRILKYETPAGAKMALDVLPSTQNHIHDPKVTLWVTEGIPKGDSLASIGLRAVSILGVYNWRGRNYENGLTALPDWETIALNERKIVICFDSDAFTNPYVHNATERVGRWLAQRGAKLSFVYLPHADDGSKQGVDDYLAAGHTREDLLARIETEWHPLPSHTVNKQNGTEPVPPMPLPDAVAIYQRWLHLEDPEPLYVCWGAIAANRLQGEPVWLLLVDVSGGGKTEIVRACGDLQECAHISSLTEAALLSGTSSSERAEDATGGCCARSASVG